LWWIFAQACGVCGFDGARRGAGAALRMSKSNHHAPPVAIISRKM
jgi:hypothetical protein